LGWQDQPRRLTFKDCPVPLPKDRVMAAANRITAEWEKKAREQKKEEKQWKQEAQDRGDDVSSDDDDEDDDEVAVGVDWGILEDEGMLTNAPLSVQEPPSFRAEGSESVRLVEVGAEESTASHEVSVEVWWVARSEEALEVLMEEGGSIAVPHKRTVVSGSATQPEVWTERGGSTAAPSETSSPA